MRPATPTPQDLPADQPPAAHAGTSAGPARVPPSTDRSPHAEIYGVLGALSVVTGALHAKAMVDHASHYWLFGVFFGVLSCWQTAWGIRAYRARLSLRALAAGAWVNVAVIVVWLLSRTSGLPIGPWAGEAEAVGVIDTLASLDELVIVGMAASLVSASVRPGLAWLRGGYAVRLGIMLGTASLFATTIGGHTH